MWLCPSSSNSSENHKSSPSPKRVHRFMSPALQVICVRRLGVRQSWKLWLLLTISFPLGGCCSFVHSCSFHHILPKSEFRNQQIVVACGSSVYATSQTMLNRGFPYGFPVKSAVGSQQLLSQLRQAVLGTFVG